MKARSAKYQTGLGPDAHGVQAIRTQSSTDSNMNEQHATDLDDQVSLTHNRTDADIGATSGFASQSMSVRRGNTHQSPTDGGTQYLNTNSEPPSGPSRPDTSMRGGVHLELSPHPALESPSSSVRPLTDRSRASLNNYTTDFSLPNSSTNPYTSDEPNIIVENALRSWAVVAKVELQNVPRVGGSADFSVRDNDVEDNTPMGLPPQALRTRSKL